MARKGKKPAEGKPAPLPSLAEVESEARQSEKRFEPDDGPRYEEPEVTVSTSAPPGALQMELSPEQLAKALDDGPLAWFTIAIEEPWIDRLKTLAQEQNQSPAQYVETLIRRQWVARPLGKGKP